MTLPNIPSAIRRLFRRYLNSEEGIEQVQGEAGDVVEEHRETEVHDQPQPVESHGNEGHTDNYIPDTEKGAAEGVAELSDQGVVRDDQVPPLAISEFQGSVDTKEDLTTLTGEEGDFAVVVDDEEAGEGESYILTGDPSVLDNWQLLKTRPDAVNDVFGRTGSVNAQEGDYTPEQVGAEPEGTVEDHREEEVHDQPQPPDAHANEAHTENFTDDTHQHTGGTDGDENLQPDSVVAGEQLDPPHVETRDDIPEGQSGLYYIEDEDQVTLRV